VKLLSLKTILAATDLDDGSRAALKTARDLGHAAGAEIHLVHVSNDDRATDAVATSARDAGFPAGAAAVHVVRGDPAHAINMLSDKLGADAILVGSHRKRHESKGRQLLGSTALALVTNASVPCMVVVHPLRLPLRRVVAGVEISDSTPGTLEVALSWASALRAHKRGESSSTVLTALHVDRAETERRRMLDEILGRVRHDAGSWAGAAIESAVTDSPDAATGIAEYARTHDADMVVLGTRGLGQESVGRLGSVAAGVMQKLDTPILLVPPAMWLAHAQSS
jgi:nucleotide-binding universal stress UspA family protein